MLRACWAVLLPVLLLVLPPLAGSGRGAAEPLVLTEAQEVELGKKMDQELEKQPGFCGNPELVAYLDQVGQRVAAQAEPRSFRYTFRILDDDSINALALPGGYIYVTRGLLAVLNDEAELAAVIGHEVGHACSRHAAKQLAKARLFQLLALGALGAAAASPSTREHMDAWVVFSNEFFTQILLGYGRDNELEADEKGIRFAFQAGYDPRRMCQFLRYLRTKEQLTGLNFQGFRVTHPETAERIIKAETLAFVLARGCEERLEVGRDRFRQHLQGLPYGPRADRKYLRIYTSKPGDTLSSIATDLLNDPTRAHEIAFLNRMKEDTPLEPGTLLKIPWDSPHSS
jgi:predicted Zn-dependent protease